MIDEKEINSLEAIRWKTISSISFDKFSSAINDKHMAEVFDDNFADKIGDRWRELERTNYRLMAALLPSILFIGAVDNGIIENISFLGINFSKQNASLGILVLLSAIIMIFSSAVSLTSDYYENLLESYVNARKTSELSDYYMLQFGWRLGGFLDGFSGKNHHISPNFFVLSVIVTWIASLVFSFVVMTLLQLFIFVNAILSVHNSSHVPDIIGLPIVVIAVCSVVFYVGCMLLRLPLPMTDRENTIKLRSIEDSDPEMAKEIWKNIASRSLEKERRNIITLQVTIFVLSIVALYVLILGTQFFSDYRSLGQIAISLMLFVLVIFPILNRYEAYVIVGRPMEPDRKMRVARYVKDKRRILVVRLAVSCIVAIISFLNFQGDAVRALL